MFGTNSASRSALRMLPVETRRSLYGRRASKEGGDKILVFGDDDPLLSQLKLIDHVVCCAIPLGQIEGVERVMTGRTEVIRQPTRELRVNEEIHAVIG